MNNKKYELLKDDTILHNGKTLYRIKALKDFSNVRKGDLGGYIAKEDNLSQFDRCWVYDNAMVFDNAKVFGSAFIYEDAKVHGNAMVFNNAKVFNNAQVYGSVVVYGYARVCGNAQICGNAQVYGNAEIDKGKIIGKVSKKYDDIVQIQCEKRMITAIKTEGQILYTISCRNNITKEKFIDRIYNENGGVENNPHRKEYLKVIKAVEAYFEEVV